MAFILEACVDSVESAIAAKKGGADRLELTSNLIIGGTTPSIELFNTINENTDIKSNILIRPRFGDFCYTDYEFEVIKKELTLFKNAGANGVVIGILLPDGSLDMERMKVLMEISSGMEVTIHRCFDVTKNPYETLSQAEELGVNTILTSGQVQNAIDGMDLLNDLQNSTKKINIMAGSGINYNSVSIMLEKTNLKAFHLSGKEVIDSKMVYRNEKVTMGLPMASEFDIWQTNEDTIREIRNLLDNKLV